MLGFDAFLKLNRLERRSLVQSLLVCAGERTRLREMAAGRLRWDRIAQVARDYCVLSAVHHSVAKLGLESWVDEATLEEMREDHRQNTVCNGLMLSELGRATEALRARGIETLALKGSALLLTDYPDIGARAMADLDLLVASGQTGRAAEVLRDFGYSAQPPGAVPGCARDLVRDPLPDHPAPLSGPWRTKLELHVQAHGIPEEALPGLWLRTRTVVHGGHSIRIPGRADLLAMLSGHVFFRHRSEARLILRHLVDVHAIAASDEGVWEEAARLYQHDPATRAALRFSAQLLAAAERGREALLATVAAQVRAFVAVARGARFFPPLDYMAWRYQVSRRSPLLPTLYLLRPALGLWRFLSGRSRPAEVQTARRRTDRQASPGCAPRP